MHAVKGNLANREALMKALRPVKSNTVRDGYRINRDGFPILDYYLRVVSRAPDGRIVNKSLGVVLKNHADAHVKDWPLK